MRPLLLLTFVTAALPAQVISPAKFAMQPGGRFDDSPFGGYPQNVFQQIHGDLRGQAMMIRELSFRNGLATVQSTARTVELELEMGASDFGSANAVFALNYLGSPTIVFARKPLSLPDWTRTPSGGYPGPFDAGIVLDTPLAYPGTLDLTWKLTVFDNSTRSGNVANTYIADGFRQQTYDTASGVKVGTGCMPTGRFVEMLGTLNIFAEWLPTPTYRVGPGFNYGPRNTSAVVWLATSDPNLPVPGLCANLRVGGPLLPVNGMTGSQLGAFFGPEFQLPFDPSLVGATIHSQGAAFDPGQPGLPYALSSGRATSFPSLPPPLAPVSSVVARATSTATSGSLIEYGGLVVRFR